MVLMPPTMKMSSPQLITWLPTRTRARWSPRLKSLLSHASSRRRSRVARSLALSSRGLRCVSSAFQSNSAEARTSPCHPVWVRNPNSGMIRSRACTTSFLL